MLEPCSASQPSPALVLPSRDAVWRLGAPDGDAATQQILEPSRIEGCVPPLPSSKRRRSVWCNSSFRGPQAPAFLLREPWQRGSKGAAGAKGFLPLPSFSWVHPLFSQPKDGKENNLWDRDDSWLVVATDSSPSQLLRRRAAFLGCFPLSK